MGRSEDLTWGVHGTDIWIRGSWRELDGRWEFGDGNCGGKKVTKAMREYEVAVMQEGKWVGKFIVLVS